MPDYIERVILESFKLPSDIILKSIDEAGRYWITSDGRVLSVVRNQPRYKHFTDNGEGYLYTEIDGKKQYLHRLLALSFNTDPRKEPIKNTMEVHHLDRDRANNELSNLCLLSKEDHRKIHDIWRKLDSWEVIPWEQMEKGNI